jgi:hypothetical protein
VTGGVEGSRDSKIVSLLRSQVEENGKLYISKSWARLAYWARNKLFWRHWTPVPFIPATFDQKN